MNANDHDIGVGPTAALNLRVSVASLVWVLFDGPDDERAMAALERTATLREVDGRPVVTVRAKPFGGAVRVIDPGALRGMIGDFHYDSRRSRRERDFRLQIRPASWEMVKGICRDHLRETESRILDISPERELSEEFGDTLHLTLTPDLYHLESRGMVFEDEPRETDSVRAPGRLTVRVYFVFEARVEAPEVIAMMLATSGRYSDRDLEEAAREDARRGGRGRANAVLTVGMDDLKEALSGRSGPVRIGEHLLDGNVAAIQCALRGLAGRRNPGEELL